MSRIDDALTRVTGQSVETPKPSSFNRFASEGHAGRRGTPDDRRYPTISAAARQAIDARTHAAGAASDPTLGQDIDPTDRMLSAAQLAHYAGFAARAVWRHRGLVSIAFVLSFVFIVAATSLVPRTYEVEVKLLAQRNALMASLSNPGRVVPYDAEAPTRAAAETILRRDNVIALIRQTNLLNEWDRTRAPILKFADGVMEKIRRRPLTLDDKLDNLVAQIERRMDVAASPSGDGLVKIYLSWPDPHSAYLLVTRAQQAFIDARQVAETQAIGEAIRVLEGYANNLSKEIQVTLGELSDTETRVIAAMPTDSTLTPRRASSGRIPSALPDTTEESLPAYDGPLVDPATLADPRLTRLKATLGVKRWELSRLEEEQKRKLNDLDAQLRAAQLIYTPNHPTVVALQQSRAAYQYKSPQILALRNELEELEDLSDTQAAQDAERLIQLELSRRAAMPAAARRPRPAPLTPVAAPAPAPETPATPDLADLAAPRRDSVIGFATLRLRTELNQLRQILERTDSARIEAAVSQAASKNRYTIIQPAEEPGERDQSFPDTRRILITGLMVSVLFAIVAAIVADILSNRILEPWQVQRQLGLPILGTVKLS